MKNLTKKVFICLLVFILFLFISLYINRQSNILKDYYIQEKLIVKFKGYTGTYLLDLNSLDYKEYHSNYDRVEITNLKELEKIYNYNNSYYYGINGIYNTNEKKVYTFFSPSYSEKYWTKDEKYLINNDSQVVYMFGLFFPQRIGIFIPYIVELGTWKSKQLLIYDVNGNILSIEKILGYIK